RKPFALYVSRAEGGEAALFRRHPEKCRRISAVLAGLRAAGRETAPRQSGLAHSFRRAAEGGNADHILDVACARFFIKRGKRRYALGLYRPLSAGGDARDASEASPAR